MAGGDQFVIHLLSRYAEMAGQAGLGADLRILGIDHAGSDAGLVRILAGVRSRASVRRGRGRLRRRRHRERVFSGEPATWQTVQRLSRVASAILRTLAMRLPRGSARAWYARACLSATLQWHIHCRGCGSRRRRARWCRRGNSRRRSRRLRCTHAAPAAPACIPQIANRIRASLISASLYNQNHDQCDGKEHGNRDRNIQRPVIPISRGGAAAEKGVWHRSHSVAEADSQRCTKGNSEAAARGRVTGLASAAAASAGQAAVPQEAAAGAATPSSWRRPPVPAGLPA